MCSIHSAREPNRGEAGPLPACIYRTAAVAGAQEPRTVVCVTAAVEGREPSRKYRRQSRSVANKRVSTSYDITRRYRIREALGKRRAERSRENLEKYVGEPHCLFTIEQGNAACPALPLMSDIIQFEHLGHGTIAAIRKTLGEILPCALDLRRTDCRETPWTPTRCASCLY